ncbi:MAG: hypothetical protein Q4C71_02100 [Microbacteriaceae bacterium]|nr:hypothetical protein [Microbacteriaceae bacterium]
MAKILQANSERVLIGMDNGQTREVQTNSLTFIPQAGDKVEVFENGDNLIVNKIVTETGNSAGSSKK